MPSLMLGDTEVRKRKAINYSDEMVPLRSPLLDEPSAVPLTQLPPRSALGVADGESNEPVQYGFQDPLLERDDVSSGGDDDRELLIPSQMVDETQLETSFMILLQVAFPFIVAGLGMVGAGLVLDVVQHWRVFTQVPEIFILVPALLGLKGNLEMTLASRLSTMANLGRMDKWEEQRTIVVANLALIQAQAIVVAFLASSFAIVLAWIPKGTNISYAERFEVDWAHAFLLSSASLTTASLASLILGIIMAAVVLGSRRFNINPDNVATPIAASLGDLTTLAVLAGFGTMFLNARSETPWLNPAVTFGWLALAPLWAWLAYRNTNTRGVLLHGWCPVIFAMCISSGGGFILKFAVQRFHGIAVFQPVMNGIGGNLVAVQASRISTSLHGTGKPGSNTDYTTLGLPFDANCCLSPTATLLGNGPIPRAGRVLLLMVVPGHLLFIYLIHFLQAGHTTITLLFATAYLTAALLQVAILLHVCVGMMVSMWNRGVDPDNSAIPYLTALGDLLGTALLAIAFLILFYLGDRDADIGE